MSSAFFKLSEFFLIFIIIPIAFALDFNVWVKLILGLFGFIYIIVLLVKVEKLSFDIAPNLNWKSFFKRVFIKLMVIAVVTSLYVFITDKESLFNVVIAKPKLWVVILIVYSLGVPARIDL